ncbi:YdcF family protein [Roseovarius sp. B08]|uniref:YdcF family protein n=1 Tax=Roseovarius sp. B08 TaxID=3449223 RepID=UPI003EDC1FD6
MRRLGKLLLFVVVAYLLLVGAMRVYVETYRQDPVQGPVSAIVVLSSGPVRDDREGRTGMRTRAGVELYFTQREAGHDPKLVLSGGIIHPESPSMAEDMRDFAVDLGVPSDKIIVEGRSGSTLQNALFSHQLLGDAASGQLAVVTDRFHIPRAWTSFRWAGMSDLVMVSADGETEPVDWDNLMGEGIKWPANAVRGLVFSILSTVGWAEKEILWIIE